jgi:glycosyltransferase involved in cell wall biosynthesis
MAHMRLPADVAHAAALAAAALRGAGGGSGSGEDASTTATTATTATTSGRPYLTCCVRLSPEKEPHRFVELVAELERRGALRRHGEGLCVGGCDLVAAWAAGALVCRGSGVCPLHACNVAPPPIAALRMHAGLTPLLVGAAKTDYAEGVRRALRAAAPTAVIEDRFLGPGQLVEEVYACTRLNVHPCLYDAYGMTVVEMAAAGGAPSLVAGGGHVGATDLLSGAAGECFEVDMDVPIAELADGVEALLSDRGRLAAVGAAAAARARCWDLDAYASRLGELVRQAVARHAFAAGLPSCDNGAQLGRGAEDLNR